MMHLCDTNNRIIISLAPLIGDNFVGNKLFYYNGLFFYLREEQLFQLLPQNRKNFIYYLDHFIICLPECYNLQQLLWKEFYTIFGPFYSSLIDERKNINCIRRMVKHISEVSRDKPIYSVIDFGCGTGLAAVEKQDNFQIIGYEPIGNMRKQALVHGLATIDYEEFCNIPTDFFDAGFANYVFHLSVKEDDLYNLIRVLKKGAIFIANFYKGINAQKVNTFFLKEGFEIRQIFSDNDCCGVTYEYYKK